jgi:UDP:flavonoid glycosyltransferase YjiC (YdhE family)
LEIAKAGVPAVMVPLFADQHINGKRAQRFGIAEVLDKANMTALGIESAIRKALFDERYPHLSKKILKNRWNTHFKLHTQLGKASNNVGR